LVGGEKTVKSRNVLEGIGAALLLFPYYLPFFHPQNHDIYFHGLPITNLIGGLLVDLLGVAILSAGFLIAVQHLAPPARRILEAIFAGIMVWSIVDLVFQVLLDMLYPITFWEHIWERSVPAIPLMLGILVCFLPRFIQPVVHSIRVVVAAFAFSALWIVPHLIHLALVHPLARNSAPASLSPRAQVASNRRIIWILFDELSYDQTFEHPAPGIQLPNLNSLRDTSISFSDLRPIGYSTDRIIPSLFLGHRFEKFRSTIDGTLSYWDESQRRWVAYDPQATLFAEAQRNGWKTGVNGWFNPYCGFLASVLDVCVLERVWLPTEELGASEDQSVIANAFAVPALPLAALTQQKETLADEHIQAYRNLMTHSEALIDNAQHQFLFIHLPVPHPPGIYNRQRHLLRSGGNYLDNLVLADDTLGTLLREINSSPDASQTTVIVTSDHSWRVPLWRPAEDWTSEEERASGSKFDTRPVLLVHFPGQKSGREIPASHSEMLEHEMIVGMLRGQIEKPEDLTGFVLQHNY
jgi:hypothetical protein